VSANAPGLQQTTVLSDAPLGPIQVVRITEALEDDLEALELLAGCGLLPEREAEVKATRNGWVEVAASVRDAAIPPHVAANTYVLAR
jgi:hypothetical protein